MNSIRFGLSAVVACGFLLVIAGAAMIFGVRHTNELAERQEYVGDQLFGARRVFETLLSLETIQRGYLLTGDASYLDRYTRDRDELDSALTGFEQLFREDAEVGSTVADIRSLARDKQAELAQTIDLARNGHADTSRAIGSDNDDKRLTDKLRVKFLSLVAQKRADRTRLVGEVGNTVRFLYFLGAGVAFLVMVLVSVAIRTLSVSIARLDEAQKAEEHNAMHDALTGLPNRRYLSEWLATALAGARRAGRELHVLYFDLDGFKAVNDRFGHEAGDRVLQVTASRLRETLRASDFVARLGGDEFVVVLPDTGEPPAAAALVERIAGELAAAPIPELADGMVTASIGKASYPLDGATAEALIAAADRAMYRVKQGRHRAARKRAAPREPSPLTLGQALPA